MEKTQNTTQASHTTNFDDIRPYNDDEYALVFARLIASNEFVDTMASMKFPRLVHWAPWLLRPLVRRNIQQLFAGVTTVRGFQIIVRQLLKRSLERASSQFSVSGLEKLDTVQSHLFITNHRDIAMDPALIILALSTFGLEPMRIAFGDNLLTKPFISDLIRINKSFIVRRSVSGRREKLAAFKQLSAYIRHSVVNDHESVWIAQSEGRAKDGIDRTETALLKMLALSKDKTESFGDAINAINLVPVSISYEWDPCDADKAQELYARETVGTYEKGEHEDFASIYKGIVGKKGSIHVAFGDLIQGSIENASQLAQDIDRQIINNYRLQATHLIAYERIHGSCEYSNSLKQNLRTDWDETARAFDERLSEIPQEHQSTLLSAYANPVVQKIKALTDMPDTPLNT